MVLKSPGSMPDMGESSPRRNPWGESNGGSSPDGNDSTLNSSVSSDGQTGITLQPNSHLLNSVDERRVNLVVESTPAGFIGFTLRGGAEYGLGIYVSGVDVGSLAEQSGFRVGDQILDVNGKNFENVKHKEAVDFIKSNKHIIVTLKAVGKLPEAKHYTSEISWIYPDGTIIKGPSKQQLLLYVEERAKKILVVDEYNAIINDIKQYMEDSDVESLVYKLLAILDKPEKALLLRDIRTLITSYDLGRFDAMVSAREKDALEYLSVCVPGSPSILPTTIEKPKRQLISVIQDSRGGFQIRSKEELEKLRREREAQSQVAQRAWLGGNILDRQARSTPEYYAVQSTTPEAIEMVPVGDNGPAETSPQNPGPMTLSIPVIQVNNDNQNGQDVAMETKTSPNILFVPDRVSMEYKDDEDDDVQIGGHQSAFFAFPSTSSTSNATPSEEGVLILLPKNRTSLGISISGGKGSKMQPEIRVEKIFPGGAAHDDGRLKQAFTRCYDSVFGFWASCGMRDMHHSKPSLDVMILSSDFVLPVVCATCTTASLH
ncbi:hypothetical protein QZH41_003883 [Actinostola sp. cb2023]|nr:hypothetical protein QZH41_003883 [Actinostola sp. cb2023]